jgi:hypothetical protein
MLLLLNSSIPVYQLLILQKTRATPCTVLDARVDADVLPGTRRRGGGMVARAVYYSYILCLFSILVDNLILISRKMIAILGIK